MTTPLSILLSILSRLIVDHLLLLLRLPLQIIHSLWHEILTTRLPIIVAQILQILNLELDARRFDDLMREMCHLVEIDKVLVERLTTVGVLHFAANGCEEFANAFDLANKFCLKNLHFKDSKISPSPQWAPSTASQCTFA